MANAAWAIGATGQIGKYYSIWSIWNSGGVRTMLSRLTSLWLKGLLTRRSWRLIGAILGVAMTVALLASLAAFISSSAASMTRRAVADVPVDWQVQLSPGTDPGVVTEAVGKATRYTDLEQ